MSIIGITGYAQSGKDTAAAALVEEDGYERLAFADKLREGLLGVDPYVVIGPTELAALQYGTTRPRTREEELSFHTGTFRLSTLVEKFGWDRLKVAVPEVRRLMQTYGTEGGRNIHGRDCWVDALKDEMVPGVDYVITDVRFPNEVEMIHRAGGIVVRIHRPGVEAVNSHVSDDIDGLQVDFCIRNGSTVEDLRKAIWLLAR